MSAAAEEDVQDDVIMFLYCIPTVFFYTNWYLKRLQWHLAVRHPDDQLGCIYRERLFTVIFGCHINSHCTLILRKMCVVKIIRPYIFGAFCCSYYTNIMIQVGWIAVAEAQLLIVENIYWLHNKCSLVWHGHTQTHTGAHTYALGTMNSSASRFADSLLWY